MAMAVTVEGVSVLEGDAETTSAGSLPPESAAIAIDSTAEESSVFENLPESIIPPASPAEIKIVSADHSNASSSENDSLSANTTAASVSTSSAAGDSNGSSASATNSSASESPPLPLAAAATAAVENAEVGAAEAAPNANELPSAVTSLSSSQTVIGAINASTDVDNAAGGDATAAADDDDDQSVYQIKWVKFHSTETLAIVTQNENGPCPLLAIVNVLLLRGKLKIPAGTSIITYSQLMSLLWDCILTQTPQHISAGDRLNYEKNMNDALAVIHKLQTGLDVNVKFTGVSDFEYTIESIIFDLLNISLYHGWLVDPQSPETEAALGSYSYNQIVERIISNKSSPKPELVTEALIAEEFLELTKSQLSYHGICELHNTLKDGELAVFFRNNHFSTIYKYKEELFLLVTDQGFVSEPNVTWETLANVEGDSHFVNQEFKTYAPSSSSTAAASGTTTTNISRHATAANSSTSTTNNAASSSGADDDDQQKQIDADLLVALSMQEELDKAAAAAVSSTSQNDNQTEVVVDVKDSQEMADRQLAIALQREEERLEAERNSREDGGAAGASGGAGAVGDSGSASRSSGDTGGNAARGAGRRSRPSSPSSGARDDERPGRPRQEKEKDCVIL